jgi:hypothetical protein
MSSKPTAVYEGYFPVPVFLGDGKAWNLDLFPNQYGVYIRDLRSIYNPDGLIVDFKHLKITLNRYDHPIHLGADQTTVVHWVNHVRIKTIKGAKFALFVSDRPWTTHTGPEFTPLSKSVSVYSDADHVIALNKNYRGFGGNWAVTEYSDSGSWKYGEIQDEEHFKQLVQQGAGKQ